jgi:hypothetical protein
MTLAQPVVVSLHDLQSGTGLALNPSSQICAYESSGSVSDETLQEAFGPESFGILVVKDVPDEFKGLRHKLLSYASYMGNLNEEDFGRLMGTVM